jgi:hypothetical protein
LQTREYILDVFRDERSPSRIKLQRSLDHAIQSIKRTRILKTSKERCYKYSNNDWRDHAPQLSCPPHAVGPYADFDEAFRSSPRRHDWKVVSYADPILLDELCGPLLGKQEVMNTARQEVLQFENILPSSVATIIRDWQAHNRNMQNQDRFVQYIDLCPFSPFSGTLRQLCIDEVVWVYDSKDKVGFSVATTDMHDTIGDHTLWVRY